MIVGLTGSIACGKTTVANMFKEMGCPIVDADLVAREVVMPGERGLQLVSERFGADVLAEDGTLNRKALGKIIFDEPAARADLNAILHPLIRQRMQEKKEEALQSDSPFVIMDIPLLYENEHETTVDYVVVVYIPEHVQLDRLMQRDGFSAQEAKKRIASQMDIEEKRKRADYVIDNDGSLENTRRQVEKIFNQLSRIKGNDGNKDKS
ncbi:dephospho-CoA kinase [Ammoniphilus oxalaticus]|uniref:Dephospho-CoA kinase n=1 Tax=Ammoniphilus oxalaticus TaxID=66863 RepID=A0A419SIC6_9BACL|nr:dephospho-CoA kinase [Ammoniphilus oxalaticus]RKD23794.1 dephospho-CoA kinase [Ammoniphilus oxalaticus]